MAKKPGNPVNVIVEDRVVYFTCPNELEYQLIIFQKGVYDECMSSFFRNVDSRYEDPLDIPLGNSCGKIRALKARVNSSILSCLST